jgi:hypothetical protein
MKNALTTDGTDGTDGKKANHGSTESRPTGVKLELVAPETAEKEQAVQANLKTIRLAIDGNWRAGQLFFAYAAIAGAAANRLADILPHGSLEKTLEETFPRDHRTLHNWRHFAAALLPAIGKRETAALLTAPVIGKKVIPMKALEGLQEAVLKTMDGKGMMEFMRASRMLREPQKDGGYRPDPEMVAAFLAEKHPELNRTPGPGVPTFPLYAELPEKVQKEFRKWLAGRPEPESDIAERANEQAELTKTCLIQALAGKWLMVCAKEKREDLALLCGKLGDKIKELNLPRKGAKGAKVLTTDGTDGTSDRLKAELQTPSPRSLRAPVQSPIPGEARA